MNEQTELTQAHPVKPILRVSCGVLGSDISKAVEIIGDRDQISGRSAFALLANAANDSGLSVGDFASMMVRSQSAMRQDIA